jgi:hypothetical protein
MAAISRTLVAPSNSGQRYLCLNAGNNFPNNGAGSAAGTATVGTGATQEVVGYKANTSDDNQIQTDSLRYPHLAGEQVVLS